jgi:hypothetical protein
LGCASEAGCGAPYGRGTVRAVRRPGEVPSRAEVPVRAVRRPCWCRPCRVLSRPCADREGCRPCRVPTEPRCRPGEVLSGRGADRAGCRPCRVPMVPGADRAGCRPSRGADREGCRPGEVPTGPGAFRVLGGPCLRARGVRPEGHPPSGYLQGDCPTGTAAADGELSGVERPGRGHGDGAWRLVARRDHAMRNAAGPDGPSKTAPASIIPANSDYFFIDYKRFLLRASGCLRKPRGRTVRRRGFPRALGRRAAGETRTKELRMPRIPAHYHCEPKGYSCPDRACGWGVAD